MKRLFKPIAGISAILFLNSCVYSLFPIYTPETLVYMPELVGTWSNEGTSIRFEPFEGGDYDISIDPGDDDYIVVAGDTIRDKEKVADYWQNELEETLLKSLPKLRKEGYRMIVSEKKDTIIFQARLARIGEHLFIDMYPFDAGSELGSMVVSNYFPVHTFSKINVNKETLTITDFDLTALRDLFKSNMIRLRHENVEGDILITAQPEELQKFLKLYAEDENVFDSPSKYKKING